MGRPVCVLFVLLLLVANCAGGLLVIICHCLRLMIALLTITTSHISAQLVVYCKSAAATTISGGQIKQISAKEDPENQ